MHNVTARLCLLLCCCLNLTAVEESIPEQPAEANETTSPAPTPATIPADAGPEEPGPSDSIAEATTGSESLARELIAVTGGAELGLQALDQMIAAFKRMNPDVPDSFWKRFSSKVSPDQLVDLVVPIYTKHLSDDDMRAAIAFYRSPAGAALIDKMPVIMKESMQAGQQLGSELGRQVSEELQTLKAP